MTNTPRDIVYFRNKVLLASPSKECAKTLADINLSDADVRNRLARLQYYNNAYSRIGACLPVLYPAISGVVSDFEARVNARGVTLNSTERLAINTFYDTVKGFWNKLREVYPFVGEFLNGALVPLKSTITTATASPSLTNTFYDRNLGVLVGGNGRWIDFGATSRALLLTEPGLTHSKTVSLKYDDAAFTNPLWGNAGSGNAISDFFSPRLNDDNLLSDAFSYSPATDRATAPNTTNVSGNYTLNRMPISGGWQSRAYKNGNLFASASTPNIKQPPLVNFNIGRVNFDGAFTNVNESVRIGFFVVGDGLSDGEIFALNSAINTFKAALGRA